MKMYILALANIIYACAAVYLWSINDPFMLLLVVLTAPSCGAMIAKFGEPSHE